LLSWSRFLLICLFSPLPSVSLLLQSPPLGIAPASVPSPRYRSGFSPHGGGVGAGWAPRGCHGGAGRRAGATEEGRPPRGCHGGGAAVARVPLRRGGRHAGATEGLDAAQVPRRGAGAARVPRRGRAPRGCHGIAPDSVPSPRYLVSLQHRPEARKQKLSRNKQISKSRTRF